MTLATVIFTEKWHLTCAVLQTLKAGDLNVCAVTQQSKKMFSSAQVSEVHLLACSNSIDNYPKDKKNSYFNNDLVAVLPVNIFYCHSIYTCALHNQCTARYDSGKRKTAGLCYQDMLWETQRCFERKISKENSSQNILFQRHYSSFSSRLIMINELNA